MTIQAYTPHPVKGIRCPLPKYDIHITPIGRVRVVTQAKDNGDILVIPAIKHKISSGNIGSKKASPRKNVPLFKIILEYLLQLSSPTIQETNLCPQVLPKKKEINEPISTPMLQYMPPSKGPYIRLPAMQITAAGMGKITTCEA